MQFASPEVAAQVGMSHPRRPARGGSHLVLWKHAATTAAVMIRFLTSHHVKGLCRRAASSPPGTTCWSPRHSDDPLCRVMADGLKVGRSFTSVPLWGLVEEKLNEVLGLLWADLLADPGLDVEKAVAERLESLARKLNLTLRSR